MTRARRRRAEIGDRPAAALSRWGDQRGVVLVEFSLVVVLLFFFLYGIVAYGMAIALRQSMGQAAGEAVRAAVVSSAPTPAERELVAETFALASTKGLGEPGFSTVVATVDTCASFVPPLPAPQPSPPPAGDCIQVVFEYDYVNGAIVPGGPFGVVLPDSLEASAVGRIL